MRLLNRLRRLVKAKKQTRKRTKKRTKRTGLDIPRNIGIFQRNDAYTNVCTLQENVDGPLSILRSQTTGELVVLKYAQSPKCDLPTTEQTGRRKPLPNEVRMLVSKLLPHDNIIRLYAAEQDASQLGRHRLYLEYCAGGDLHGQLRSFQDREQETPVMFTLHVLIGVSHALAYLHHGLREENSEKWCREKHHRPIIHGDVKPENIFLRWPGRQECGMPDVVLADFDMAEVAAESRGIAGTPQYDSPEVAYVAALHNTAPEAFDLALNSRVMTTKSDMFQLGLVLYLMATYKYFHAGDDPQTIDVPPQYQQVAGFVSALVWLLQEDPVQRPECTGDVENGFLLAVDCFQYKRDALWKKSGALEKDVWNVGKYDNQKTDCIAGVRASLEIDK